LKEYLPNTQKTTTKLIAKMSTKLQGNVIKLAGCVSQIEKKGCEFMI
jgi:hypothetical protein